jgi:hypothetical protein
MANATVFESNQQNVAAVVGENTAQGDGVFGIGHGVTGRGVVGTSDTHTGVEGNSTGGTGVWATSKDGEAIHAITESSVFAAIAGFNNNANGTGAAIFGQKAGSVGDAGYFDGSVHVTKTLTVDLDAVVNGSLRARVDVVLGNADCAEDFTVESAIEVEPGTVMVLTDAGTLAPATKAYDTRVTGVVSGACTYRPALILDRIEQAADRLPIALVGMVW